MVTVQVVVVVVVVVVKEVVAAAAVGGSRRRSAHLGNGLLAELANGLIIQDLAVLHDTVVALVRVRIKGDCIGRYTVPSRGSELVRW